MSEGGDKLDGNSAEEVTRYVLEHYIKHYDVVRMKLGHAKSATRHSLDELVANENSKGGNSKQISEIEAYDEMWGQIISMFRTAGISEDDLDRIEKILMRIPTLIKKYYDLLVEQDKALQELIRELDKVEYKKALAIAKKVQAGPDALSGLDPSEFELKQSSSAFIYKLSQGKGTKK